MKMVSITNALNAGNVKFTLLCMAIMIMLLVSCNHEETGPDFLAEDTESAGFDAMDDYYFDDADDLATEALANKDPDQSGRASTDERLICAVVTYTGTKESGSLKVDFGDGCEDPYGNLRKGAIILEHEGTWNQQGAHWSITFISYSINGVGLAGKRTVTVVSVTDSLVTYDIRLVGGVVTWPDGRLATREVNRRREHERHENHLLDRLIIYGTAQGTLCNGRGYFVEIIEPLIYDRSCAAEGVVIPVKGIKFIKHGNRELTVDYGDGTCDNMVTLTNKNGRTVRYEVGK